MAPPQLKVASSCWPSGTASIENVPALTEQEGPGLPTPITVVVQVELEHVFVLACLPLLIASVCKKDVLVPDKTDPEIASVVTGTLLNLTFTPSSFPRIPQPNKKRGRAQIIRFLPCIIKNLSSINSECRAYSRGTPSTILGIEAQAVWSGSPVDSSKVGQIVILSSAFRSKISSGLFFFAIHSFRR